MSIVNIISALGNNNSIWPLLVRDCGIENVAKCYMTYKQNAKTDKFIAAQATRERIIDEYGTSAVWLGGIPFISKIADKFVEKKGYSSKINPKLLDENNVQNLKANIEKFKEIAPNEVKELIKVQDNKQIFKNLQIGKFFAKTAIPIFLMGFLLPRFNFALTKQKMQESKNKKALKQQKTALKMPTINQYKEKTKSQNLSFTGVESVVTMSQLQNMMLLDAGLSVGRVSTGRNWKEKLDLGIKMVGMCFLNYIAPKYIDRGLNKVTKALFGLNVDLDPKLLNDKKFISDIKEDKIILPKLKEVKSAKSKEILRENEKIMINFIDSNPNSAFVQTAKKLNLVSMLNNEVRDPRKYLDIDELSSLANKLKTFSTDAIKSGNVEQFAKKALKAKSFNILVNVGLSSFLLAYCLPKFQFLLRQLFTGSNLEPGIVEQKNQLDKN